MDTPYSPRQRQGGKKVDTSLYVVASSMGVAQSELEKLLAGQASVGIAKKLGVSRMDLQRFIGGEVSMTMAYVLGMLQSQAQDLRDHLQRETAIGIIIGICTRAP
jgi:plasmid maintenance system antidote protein VapI